MSHTSELKKLNSVLFPLSFQKKLKAITSSGAKTAPLTSYSVQKLQETQFTQSQTFLVKTSTQTFCFFSIVADVSSRTGIDEYFEAVKNFQDFSVQKNATPLSLFYFKNLQFSSYLQLKGIELINRANSLFKENRVSMYFEKSLVAEVTQILADFAISHGQNAHQYKIVNNPEESWDWLLELVP